MSHQQQRSTGISGGTQSPSWESVVVQPIPKHHGILERHQSPQRYTVKYGNARKYAKFG